MMKIKHFERVVLSFILTLFVSSVDAGNDQFVNVLPAVLPILFNNSDSQDSIDCPVISDETTIFISTDVTAAG